MTRLRSMAGILAAALIASCAGGAETARLAAPVKVAFDNPLNLIVLQARIGDEGPFRFLLDSGAPGTVVDTELARRLRLNTGTDWTRRGTVAGSQVTASSIKGGLEFVLEPGLGVRVDQVIAAPFTEMGQTMLGQHFDGVLGSAIFFRYLVAVDYANRTIEFHEPASYRYDGDGTVLEIEFQGAQPFIRATLLNGQRRLVDFPISIDSGGVTMGHASVADRASWDSLITPDNRIVEVLGATGLSDDPEGTTHETFITRMESLILGPFRFEAPVVFYSPGGPRMASMGASLLHRFRAIFDYSGKQLILEPNADFDKPHLFDRSGLFLTSPEARDGTFEVLFVAAGTPGDEAGLIRGDVIETIDSISTREIQLNAARQMFCQDKVFRLGLQRNGGRFDVVMKTRSLFD